MAYAPSVEKFKIYLSVLDSSSESVIDNTRDDLMVTSVNVKKDYTENSFPLFVINISTTDDIARIIAEEDVSIYLKISTYEANDQGTDGNDEMITLKDILLETVIAPYIKPIPTDTSVDNDIKEAEDSDTPTTHVEITGIPKNLINKNSSVVNGVFEDTKLDTIILSLLNDVGDYNIVIFPSDNDYRGASVLVPPMNVIPAIRWLDETYGVYDSGINVFMDTYKTSVYSLFSSRMSNHSNIVTIDVLKYVETDKTDTSANQIDNDTNNVKISLKGDPSYANRELIINDAIGENVSFSSFDTSYNLINRTFKTDKKTVNNKTRSYWNSGGYQFMENKLVKSGVTGVVSLPLMNISPKYFDIDTLFNIKSATGEHITGYYNLASQNYSLTSSDNMHFSCMTSLTLLKV